MEKTTPNSPSLGQEKKEKTLLDKAMDGTISPADFRSFIVDFIKGQNTDNIRTTECSLSKTQLDWNLGGNPCPVVDFNDQQNWVTDSIKIFNNSHKKVYFLIELLANPKFAIVFTPESGSIPKNSSVDVTFKMHAFCTSKVYQMLRIAILNNKVSKNGTTRRGLFAKRTEELGHLFVSFKVESELSSSLDFEEIKMGDQVAKGGYGTVYRAEWRTTEVAVKILNTQDLVEEERENVRREIRLMSKLNYSYIVTYMGSTQIKGQPLAIVMEFVKGGSLTDLLKKDISERFKCKLALDVAKGMSFLHSHNIYHRDIKPDNMLVVSSHPDAFVNLKITDFGTSRASTFSAVRSTDPSYMAFNELSKNAASKEQRKMTKGIGTLIYQAPEIIRGETDYPIDKTDIYSMGVLMLEVFTRKEPFSEPPYDKWSKWEIEKFVASGKRVDIPNSVPSKIRALIAKCWTQVPTERSNFNEIVKILTEVMELLPPDGPPSKGSGEKIPNLGNRGSFGSGTLVMKSDIPIPNGDLQTIGWVGELERKDCESKLKGAALGTFMLRWSRTTSSYVLTYQANTSIVHIAYIKPDSTGHITVDKEDGKKAHYDNIYDYISAMKESNIITQPYLEPKAPSEDLYGKTPSLQKM